MRSRTLPLIALLLPLALVPAASAAVRAGSITLNPNPEGPQFGSPPPKPLIPVTVQYDDQAGTITVSEGGGITYPFDPTKQTTQVRATWESLGTVTLGHCENTTGVEVTHAEINWTGALTFYNPDGTFASPYGPELTDSGIGGRLKSQATVSPDASTFTAVWSDPTLAAQNFTCFSLSSWEKVVVFPGYELPPPGSSPPPSGSSPPPPKPHPVRPLTTRRATRAQLRAMTTAANARHSDGFNVHTQYLTNARVTNNGWADAEQRFRRPSNLGQTQRGVFIVFHVVAGRWHVVTYGSAVCEARQRAVPTTVCSALRL